VRTGRLVNTHLLTTIQSVLGLDARVGVRKGMAEQVVECAARPFEAERCVHRDECARGAREAAEHARDDAPGPRPGDARVLREGVDDCSCALDGALLLARKKSVSGHGCEVLTQETHLAREEALFCLDQRVPPLHSRHSVV